MGSVFFFSYWNLSHPVFGVTPAGGGKRRSSSPSPPPLRTDSELVMPLSHYYCKDAYEASMKCLETNGYDLAKCKHMQDLYKQ